MRKVMASLLLAPVAVAVGGALSSPALAEGGLPQLDVTTYPPQVVWLAITFAALYFIMSRVALPRVSQVLEERQQRIEDSLKKAETLKNEAAAAAVAYEEMLREARIEAHGVMVKISDSIAERAARRLAELGERLDRETAAAEQKIGAARDQAMRSLGDVAGEVVQAATEKFIGEALDSREVAAAVAGIMAARTTENGR